MASSNNISQRLSSLITKRRIISISGSSGTGKTSLALYLIGEALTKSMPGKGCCVWFQASELFPQKRLFRMFTNYPEKLQYLRRNFLISPKLGSCSSYHEQERALTSFYHNSVFPPGLRFIVIDNISHHLRYEVLQSAEISSKVSLINRFFDRQLQPLLMFCQREGISLVLIHEATFDPAKKIQAPFCHKLYDRIESINIVLTNEFHSQEKRIEIIYDSIHKSFKYSLVDSGFIFRS